MANQPKNARRAAQKRLNQRPPQQQTTAEQAGVSEPVAPIEEVLQEAPPPAQPEMTAVEKVKFMNALATAAQDSDLMDRICEMEQGALIYDLFVGSINKQLEALMGGGSAELEEVGAQVYDTANDCNYVRQTMGEFQRLIQSFIGTPLVQTLQVLNQNLGGAQPQQAPPQQQQFAQPPQQQPQQQYPPNVHARPPQQPQQQQQDGNDRGSGIGSY